MPLLDCEDRVFAVLVGRPKSEDWSEVQRDIQTALDGAREGLRGSGSNEPPTHRRGVFTPLASGISYGGGQKVPCNGSISKETQRIIDGLLSNRSIQRVAGFGDAAFKTYAPRLHQYYEETLSALLEKDSRLRPNFRNSVFGSITFNLGPQTVTCRHTDFQNLPAGWCAITAIGDFDPVEGGHIILWEAQLVIEFPPGSTILIPSAVIHHSNTTIRPHESRYSITQYSAGGLFRWVECGFM
ncbi:uncharacterized protein TRAVEDRAFT_39488 [Trametes versicolor FP-101664 SS1]|uniref:uncharacterized protein n=1 Tax=Trametes versicolor (strain FP-101664) TaxID=717944 RepID=UPI0004622A58|nr:uncharacterized protein TRAVEDRAFT_39488 [Trametes versicolor FP-101664 SS1]EIW55165.1 hypothetical protein TRAVEDRAFT_39488 [Trametes versicolor FP-101664 SS1]